MVGDVYARSVIDWHPVEDEFRSRDWIRRGAQEQQGGVAVAGLDSPPSSPPWDAVAVVRTPMARTNAPLSTPRLPGLSTWIWGAFLLAAVDRVQIAEGQTVRQPESTGPRR